MEVDGCESFTHITHRVGRPCFLHKRGLFFAAGRTRDFPSRLNVDRSDLVCRHNEPMSEMKTHQSKAYHQSFPIPSKSLEMRERAHRKEFSVCLRIDYLEFQSRGGLSWVELPPH
ncbi:MAG: hypothetical protein DRO87_01660 [Candidatus Thorarchaeota archaeon]|nr:MAG: hypothetical protein DRP09_16040 [Candidatus Thorarchaeota archaeon]RLI59881.1 MAG: hypothetical protein DRO87_01660 [Candidatus Thorarchaeota archaeon]